MQSYPTDLSGVTVIKTDVHEDARGQFYRSYCSQWFEENHLNTQWVQSNVSTNKHKHTLRGFHYQTGPFQENKLVRCLVGTIIDVALDLRPDSPTYLKHFKITLSEHNKQALLIPKGCAHAYLTLTEVSTIHYQVSAPYSPEHEQGVLWNDPSLAIDWPVSNPILSTKDQHWTLLNDREQL